MNRRDSILALATFSVASPAALGQQQGRVWRVGFLSAVTASSSSENVDAFLRGMRDLGYVEGKNLLIEWRFADGQFERLPSLATDLAQSKVDVIVAAASPAIAAAQKVTTTIPIVMATTGDPVGSGFVKSLARPGGNVTGLSNMSGDIGSKLFGLLYSAAPKLTHVGVLVTPTSSTYLGIWEGVQTAAAKAGVKSSMTKASSQIEIENAFSIMARSGAGAVIVGSSSLFSQQRQQIAELTLKYRMPSMFGNSRSVEAGGLMSYGYKVTENYQRAAAYVDKLLKGASPGDLPVEQPVTFRFVVNLKTARTIGLTIPQSLLLLADEIIQ